MSEWTQQEHPRELRKRAVWYRDFSKICGGDNTWALQLAEHFERLAVEREHMLRGKPPSE